MTSISLFNKLKNKGDSGVALITVMLLGVFGAAIIIVLSYMSHTIISTSNISQNYLQALDIGKNIASFISNTVMSATRGLQCGVTGSNICIPQNNINCPATSNSYIFIPTSLYNSSSYTVTACYLFAVDDADAVEPYTMYGFHITVTNIKSSERADIDFVLKVQ